ncbi:uncharacterized protein LOC143034500 [Oratosquilla oratoria]|uniref:uncharacterized protein LOC143034500 n=1 Tax=Oratosquilla oratoria TaxID=337810 RepID=UPI003F7684BE
MHQWRATILVLVIWATGPLSYARADDRFTCCMGGWKVMKGVTLCPAPCCSGYEERTLSMPFLKSPVICHKLTQEELRKKEEESRMKSSEQEETNQIMDDQPRRMIRASSEFEEFLFSNRHFFLDLLSQGYSRKELITNFEEFLKTISSVIYAPRWFHG